MAVDFRLQLMPAERASHGDAADCSESGVGLSRAAAAASPFLRTGTSSHSHMEALVVTFGTHGP